ncbi:MAG: acyl-CoA thioesterase [Pseudomonadota bacterium]
MTSAPVNLPYSETAIEIPFHDVDVLQITWHGHYIKYFEIARCDLLRKIGYDYPQMKASGFIWPVTECYVKYIRPSSYGQRVIVSAQLIEYENRMKINYLIRDSESGNKLTSGYTIQVALNSETKELQFVTPQVLWDQIENHENLKDLKNVNA